MSIETTNEKITNELNFQRSAAAPVGIVAVVSMNTIWKRNMAATAGVYCASGSMKPVMPNRPKSFPKRWTTNSFESVVSPPKVASAPTPPICRPNPTK